MTLLRDRRLTRAFYFVFGARVEAQLQLEPSKQPLTYEEALVRLRPILDEAIHGELAGSIIIGSTVVESLDVAQDYDVLRAQIAGLERRDLPGLVALLRYGDALVRCPVRLHADKVSLENHVSTQRQLVAERVETAQVKPEELHGHFADRAAEHLARRAAYSAAFGSGSPNVTITTKRTGDQIVYSKGYFRSTMTGFGTSTPATNYLAAGNYDFGVMVRGAPKWNRLLYPVPDPTGSPIHIPLP